MVFISRASDNGVTVDWLMKQPIFVRKEYYKQFQEILKKREQEANIQSNSKK